MEKPRRIVAWLSCLRALEAHHQQKKIQQASRQQHHNIPTNYDADKLGLNLWLKFILKPNLVLCPCTIEKKKKTETRKKQPSYVIFFQCEDVAIVMCYRVVTQCVQERFLCCTLPLPPPSQIMEHILYGTEASHWLRIVQRPTTFSCASSRCVPNSLVLSRPGLYMFLQ